MAQTGFPAYSKTAASNATADSAQNWAEGMAPSAVNDSARGGMASLARWRDDTNGSIATTGTSTAYAITTNTGMDAFAADYVVAFQIDEDCGTPVTLNVDSKGAKPLRSAPNVELAAGALKAGGIYSASYKTSNSGEWILQNVTPTILADGQVATAKIADGAVTYAKMQDVSATKRLLGRKTSGAGDVEELTISEALDFVGSAADGDILYRNGGAWLLLPKGTDGKYLLLSSGLPAWGASPGAVLISTQVASNVSVIDFTGLDSTYEAYEIVLSNVKPQNDDVQMLMRVGTGAGPIYQSSGYSWAFAGQAGASQVTDGSSSASAIGLSYVAGSTAAVGNATGENFSAKISFGNPAASDFMEISMSGAYSRSDGTHSRANGSGRYNSAGAITAVRFLFSSGNISSGRFTLYGYRKS